MYLLYNHFHAKYDLTHDTRYCRSRFSRPREHEGEKGNISKCPLSFWPKFWGMLRSYFVEYAMWGGLSTIFCCKRKFHTTSTAWPWTGGDFHKKMWGYALRSSGT